MALNERERILGKKPFKFTIFESFSVLGAFKREKFTEFYKVVLCEENADLAKQYKVQQDNTLVFCAPDGRAVLSLAGRDCNQTNVINALKWWPKTYQAWQKKEPPKRTKLLPSGL